MGINHTMRSLTRSLEKNFPNAYASLRTARDKRGLRRVFSKIADKDLIVQAGPFRGLRYLPQLTSTDTLLSHTVIPKLLGSYELELHDSLKRAFARQYKQVINIGCAEGYYAVGLALGLPGIPVFAFDIDAANREFCGEMATINGVADRIFIRGECTVAELTNIAAANSLIVCDCEGCELELLDLNLVPVLEMSDVMVELHDCVNDIITPTILARFAKTHDEHVVQKVNRYATDYPVLKGLTPLQQRLALSEFRWGPLQWAFLTAKG